MAIAENLVSVRKQISEAAFRSGRRPEDIHLVAVSKTKSAGDVEKAALAGQLVFGENYVQELATKATLVKEPVEWHFIGHLQSNKVKQIAGLVTTVHSVDRRSLAEELDRQWEKTGSCCKVLVQINISGETTKSGTAESEAINLVTEISKLRNIQICGLMTMPPFFDDPEGARPYFRALKELADKIAGKNIPGVSMEELSMGMSGDFQVAIEEGATMVRIGSAIFGER
jgi:pyridoxal phosphate enzyme (YggS family)